MRTSCALLGLAAYGQRQADFGAAIRQPKQEKAALPKMQTIGKRLAEDRAKIAA